jgi:hypothetical protein
MKCMDVDFFFLLSFWMNGNQTEESEWKKYKTEKTKFGKKQTNEKYTITEKILTIHRDLQWVLCV